MSPHAVCLKGVAQIAKNMGNTKLSSTPQMKWGTTSEYLSFFDLAITNSFVSLPVSGYGHKHDFWTILKKNTLTDGDHWP